MKREQAKELATVLIRGREALGISIREASRRSSIRDSTIVRLEQGQVPNPRPDTLKELARVLDLELADLYAAAGYAQPTSLPSFTPYLRSKYADLPSAAQQELETTFARIAKKYGYDANGPAPGQDEN